jgi:hypothetical protein
MPIVLKSGSLNLLEPSGPVQGCNGVAFASLWARLRAGLSGVRIPVYERDVYFLRNVGTVFGAHPASYLMAAGVRGGKAAGVLR